LVQQIYEESRLMHCVHEPKWPIRCWSSMKPKLQFHKIINTRRKYVWNFNRQATWMKAPWGSIKENCGNCAGTIKIKIPCHKKAHCTVVLVCCVDTKLPLLECPKTCPWEEFSHMYVMDWSVDGWKWNEAQARKCMIKTSRWPSEKASPLSIGSDEITYKRQQK
jgi:hypothetical protein